MIKARLDNVFIKQLDKNEETTESGLYISSDISNKWDETQIGIVKYVGPGRLAQNGVLIPTEVKVGDKVAFERNEYIPKIKHDGEEYMVMKEEAVQYIIVD